MCGCMWRLCISLFPPHPHSSPPSTSSPSLSPTLLPHGISDHFQITIPWFSSLFLSTPSPPPPPSPGLSPFLLLSIYPFLSFSFPPTLPYLFLRIVFKLPFPSLSHELVMVFPTPWLCATFTLSIVTSRSPCHATSCITFHSSSIQEDR